MKNIHKFGAVLVLGAVMSAGKMTTAGAAEEPIAGISLTLKEFYQVAEKADEKAVHSLLETFSVQDLAFAQVSNYVNIRDKASEEGKILGKLYDNAAATILSKEDGWYKIKSGSVSGYIKADYLATGDKARELAKTAGTRIAVVNTTTLKVRAKASTEAEVLTLVAEGEDLPVVKEQEGWVKVKYNENRNGFISADYVKLQTIYEEAVSIEEEQQRLAEEAAADRQSNSSSSNSSQSSSSSSNSSSKSSSSGSSSSKSSSSGSSSQNTSGSSLGNQIVSYAKQFVGNPYVWGGTSLTRGADCSGFTQSVFKHFGIRIPRTSRSQAAGGTRVSISNLRVGDLVFYTKSGTINHVAIYIGGGKVISASSPSTGIRITSLYYRTPYKAVRYN